MTIEKAKRVEELRCGLNGEKVHSWRALSEKICKEFSDEDQMLAGNQLHGSDLCYDAIELLYGDGDIDNVPEDIRDKWDI